MDSTVFGCGARCFAYAVRYVNDAVRGVTVGWGFLRVNHGVIVGFTGFHYALLGYFCAIGTLCRLRVRNLLLPSRHDSLFDEREMLNRRLLRIKVLQVLYGYYSGNGDDLARAEADLSRVVALYYRLVFDMARLPWQLTREMERRLAYGMQKIRPTEEELHPNRRFVENQVIAALAENPALKPKDGTVSDDWCNREELLAPLLTLLGCADFYKQYMCSPAGDWASDRAFLAQLYDWLDDQDELHEAAAEESGYWVTDLDTALELLYDVVERISPERAQNPKILPPRMEDEFSSFACNLLRSTILQHSAHGVYIQGFLHNWDTERIATIDMLILHMGLTEMLNFSEIPWRVSMNEYIELARLFSTPQSPSFVNGVLNGMVQRLIEEGKLVKTGRGLLGGKQKVE